MLVMNKLSLKELSEREEGNSKALTSCVVLLVAASVFIVSTVYYAFRFI